MGGCCADDVGGPGGLGAGGPWGGGAGGLGTVTPCGLPGAGNCASIMFSDAALIAYPSTADWTGIERKIKTAKSAAKIKLNTPEYLVISNLILNLQYFFQLLGIRSKFS